VLSGRPAPRPANPSTYAVNALAGCRPAVRFMVAEQVSEMRRLIEEAEEAALDTSQVVDRLTFYRRLAGPVATPSGA
jgi:hypothetical protein